jgi:hypothetical protein
MGGGRVCDRHGSMIDDQTSTPLASDSPADWRQRAQHLREQQWTLAQHLVALLRRTLVLQPQRMTVATSLAQADRLLRLAAHLGRLSTELSDPELQADYQCPKCCAARKEWEDALAKVYGQPEETTSPSTPNPLPANGSPSPTNP